MLVAKLSTVCGPASWLTDGGFAAIVNDGGSLTAFTLIVIVFGVGSRSVPPPLSCTWKVNDVYGVPNSLATGVNFSRPPLIFATGIKSPALTATLLFVRDPAPGNVVIFTASSVFGGLSFGSLKPKSAAVNVYAVSSFVETVLSAPDGGSLTEFTVRTNVSVAVRPLVAVTVTVIVVVPV